MKKSRQVEQPDGTFKVLASKFAAGKVVKGAPYSATATTEHIQMLSDGNQIVRKNESTLYRDSEGRTRVDQTLETIGKWTADGKAQQSIFINDPVAGVYYSLDPSTHIAHKIVTPQKMQPAEAGSKVFKINDKIVTQAEFEEFAAKSGKRPRAEGEPLAKPRTEASNNLEMKSSPAMPKPGNPAIDVGQKKIELLGARTIEGVTAEGTRSTLTIPAVEIGNTQPLEIVDETWYSSELQINVMTRHRDPRSGETTYRLTNLNRSEPDRSLFEVPADYTVRENNLPLKPKPTKEEE